MMSVPQKKLKIALLVARPDADFFTHDILKYLLQRKNLFETFVIISKCKDYLPGIKQRLFNLAVNIEKKVLIRKQLPDEKYFRDYLLSTDADKTITVNPVSSSKGSFLQFSREDVTTLKKIKPDLILNFSNAEPGDEIANIPEMGFISFQHRNEGNRISSPPGFWEVYHKKEQTEFIIERTTTDKGKREIVFKGSYPTQYSYLLNQVFFLENAYHHIKSFLESVAVTGKVKVRKTENAFKAQRYPNLYQTLKYLVQLSFIKFRKASDSIRGRSERWEVRYSTAEWDNLELSQTKTVSNPPHTFYADPFIFFYKSKPYLFVEEFCYKRGKGMISVLEYANNSFIKKATIIDEEFHLSFPFIFEHENEIYMCPETWQSGQIRLYKCTSFPEKWELVKVLMDGVHTVDTMLMQKDGKWYMLTNIMNPGGGATNELFIYYADDLFSGKWQPHAMNPIMVDASNGRNAGLLKKDGKFFRAAQGFGFDLYGKKISIFEILKITPFEYEEKLVEEILPSYDKKVIGNHHLSSHNGFTVFDTIVKSFLSKAS
ncbi:MAG: hypothetical protein SFU87_19325 [Chitinophagaceae bacterium]|nr:hypothetical protein [Chitinophagaceae bacterium]